MPAKILIADDDIEMLGVIRGVLERYETVFASDGRQTIEQVKAEKPELVVLDLRLPDIDGLILISMIRAYSTVPIIVLSGRHEQSDVVVALRAGADDFVWKPFDIYDLEARVEAVLRRSTRVPIPPTEEALEFGSLRLYQHQASVNGHELAVTPTGYKVLAVLIGAHGDMVPRYDMVASIWGATDAALAHALRNQINNLRIALRQFPGAPKIRTDYARGYRLV